MKHEKILAVLFLITVVIVACEKTMPPAPDENSLLDGPMEGLSTEEQAQFLKGDEAFGEVFTIEKGLGPIFVANRSKGAPGQRPIVATILIKTMMPRLSVRATPQWKRMIVTQAMYRRGVLFQGNHRRTGMANSIPKETKVRVFRIWGLSSINLAREVEN